MAAIGETMLHSLWVKLSGYYAVLLVVNHVYIRFQYSRPY